MDNQTARDSKNQILSTKYFDVFFGLDTVKNHVMLNGVKHLKDVRCGLSEMLSVAKHDNEIQRNFVDKMLRVLGSRFSVLCSLFFVLATTTHASLPPDTPGRPDPPAPPTPTSVPRAAPTLADVWVGRAQIAPTFEVITGVGPGHQRVSFAPGPNGETLAFSRANCSNKNVHSAPYCLYRSTSGDGLHFDEANRTRLLDQRNFYDPSVIRLPNGWYLMAFESSGINIGIAASVDGEHWNVLLGSYVISCANDNGYCKRLGGAPNRGTTNYNRYSVSTPGLAYRFNPADNIYTIYVYFAPRVTETKSKEEAHMYLGLRTFTLPASGKPRLIDSPYQRDLVLWSDPQGPAWDAQSIASPVITTGDDGAFYMLYEGAPDGYLKVGQPYSIGFARSVDGVTWEKYAGTGLLMAATQPSTLTDGPNLDRGGRSYPGLLSVGNTNFITQAYRGADDETRADYTVRYQIVWNDSVIGGQ